MATPKNGKQLVNKKEQGAILVIVLVLIFAVTLALLAYLYLNRNNTLIASNLAVQNSAQESSDLGLQDASNWLNALGNWPDVLAAASASSTAPRFFPNLSGISGYLASGPATSTTPIQAPSNPAFWTSCAANNFCYALPNTVSYGPFSYRVEYVMFPAGGMATQQSGSEQSQTGNNPGTLQARYYTVYVHVMKVNGGGLGVTVQAVIKKVMAS